MIDETVPYAPWGRTSSGALSPRPQIPRPPKPKAAKFRPICFNFPTPHRTQMDDRNTPGSPPSDRPCVGDALVKNLAVATHQAIATRMAELIDAGKSMRSLLPKAAQKDTTT